MAEQAGNPGKELAGKIALVTGASRGVGEAISEVLAKKGANLILSYTSSSSAERTKELASRIEKAYSVKTHIVAADIGSVDGPTQLIESASQAFHGGPGGKFQLDIIVNNAGVSVNRRIEDCDAEDFDFQYHVNVRGPLLLIKAALPYLPHDRSGRIVNISSVSSWKGNVSQSVYGGTKAALEAMTRTWARELAERATVNALNPGPIATDMYMGAISDPKFMEAQSLDMAATPLAPVRAEIDDQKFLELGQKMGGRPAYPLEIANLVALLCSPDASWTTGSVLNANGGMVMTA